MQLDWQKMAKSRLILCLFLATALGGNGGDDILFFPNLNAPIVRRPVEFAVKQMSIGERPPYLLRSILRGRLQEIYNRKHQSFLKYNIDFSADKGGTRMECRVQVLETPRMQDYKLQNSYCFPTPLAPKKNIIHAPSSSLKNRHAQAPIPNYGQVHIPLATRSYSQGRIPLATRSYGQVRFPLSTPIYGKVHLPLLTSTYRQIHVPLPTPMYGKVHAPLSTFASRQVYVPLSTQNHNNVHVSLPTPSYGKDRSPLPTSIYDQFHSLFRTLNHAHTGPPLLGGRSPANPTSEEVQEIAKFAVSQIDRKSDTPKSLGLVRVVAAESQVVAGKNYFLTMHVAPTNCPKGSFNPNCMVNPNEVTKECKATVWDQPWTKKREMTEFFCRHI